MRENLEFSYEVRPGEYVKVSEAEQRALDRDWDPDVEQAEAFLERLRQPEGAPQRKIGSFSASARPLDTVPVIDFYPSNFEPITLDPWFAEREDVLRRFAEELRKATGDGSKKRQAGEKPAWYKDQSHEGAVFSHLMKWKRGEKVDKDSGAHPLVHAAWRLLAIACAESGNVPTDVRELPSE